ncbi:hypothetical protein HDU91_003966 [Kappamyces sp. JEL0680]|nr:hypothetical protein HDU91_003966 [Kappamyces sp. JEL0680]
MSNSPSFVDFLSSETYFAGQHALTAKLWIGKSASAQKRLVTLHSAKEGLGLSKVVEHSAKPRSTSRTVVWKASQPQTDAMLLILMKCKNMWMVRQHASVALSPLLFPPPNQMTLEHAHRPMLEWGSVLIGGLDRGMLLVPASDWPSVHHNLFDQMDLDLPGAEPQTSDAFLSWIGNHGVPAEALAQLQVFTSNESQLHAVLLCLGHLFT